MSSRIDSLVDALVAVRKTHSFPSELREGAHAFGLQVLRLLFPHFSRQISSDREAVIAELRAVEATLVELQKAVESHYEAIPPAAPHAFVEGLKDLHLMLRDDADAIFHGDPAARSVDEVILTYPGFFAIAIFRMAHALHLLGYPLLPRLLTEFAHQQTGVDIHPGATIGRRFVIDHGSGVVIGETTVIGNRVKLYQGVTLGALVVTKEQSNRKRHPTIEDDVVIYSNATILGGDTVVGHDSVVAGNAWLTNSVPPFSTVSRRSEIRTRTGTADDELDFII